MENDVLDQANGLLTQSDTTGDDDEAQEVAPGAVRSAERALEPRFAAYLEEAQRLIRAGLEELRETGTVDPRVADIVKRAGLSNKAFYRHFHSKDELLLAVLEEGMRQRAREFESALADAPSAMERIERWIWLVLEQALDPRSSAQARPLIVHQARLIDELGDHLWTHTTRMMEPLKKALEEARDNGELKEVDPVRDAHAIYSIATGWMNNWVTARVIPAREDANKLAQFAIRGLQR